MITYYYICYIYRSLYRQDMSMLVRYWLARGAIFLNALNFKYVYIWNSKVHFHTFILAAILSFYIPWVMETYFNCIIHCAIIIRQSIRLCFYSFVPRIEYCAFCLPGICQVRFGYVYCNVYINHGYGYFIYM